MDALLNKWMIGCGEALFALFLVSGPGAGLASPREPIRICAAAISADGKLAVTANSRAWLNLWDVDSGRVKKCFGFGECVLSLAFSPDKQFFVMVSNGKTERLSLWSVKTCRRVRILENSKNCSWPGPVFFSRDGKFVFSACDGRSVRRWNVETGKLVGVYRGHEDTITGFALHPDGVHFASCSRDETVRYWSVESERPLWVLRTENGWLNSVDFSPTGRYMLTGDGASVRLWELATRKVVTSFRPKTSSPIFTLFAVFMPDGRKVIVSGDVTPCLVDLVTGKQLANYPCTRFSYGERPIVSSDGQRAMFFVGWPCLSIWQLSPPKQLQKLRGDAPLDEDYDRSYLESIIVK